MVGVQRDIMWLLKHREGKTNNVEIQNYNWVFQPLSPTGDAEKSVSNSSAVSSMKCLSWRLWDSSFPHSDDKISWFESQHATAFECFTITWQNSHISALPSQQPALRSTRSPPLQAVFVQMGLKSVINTARSGLYPGLLSLLCTDK